MVENSGVSDIAMLVLFLVVAVCRGLDSFQEGKNLFGRQNDFGWVEAEHFRK